MVPKLGVWWQGGGFFYKESVAPLGFYWVSAFWSILDVLGVKWLPFWRYWRFILGGRGTPGGFRRPVGFE